MDPWQPGYNNHNDFGANTEPLPPASNAQVFGPAGNAQPTDFYGQFEQSVNNAQFGQAKKPRDKKKVAIIASVVAVLIIAIIAVIFLLLNKNQNGNGTGTINKQAATEYAEYFVFGDGPTGYVDENLSNISDFYFNDFGKDSTEYMNNIKSKLTALYDSATGEYEEEVLEQVEWFNFYETATAYLNNSSAKHKYSVPDNEFWAAEYEFVTSYIEAIEEQETAVAAYNSGAMSQEEFSQYTDKVSTAKVSLTKKRREAYEAMAEYAKELYEQK